MWRSRRFGSLRRIGSQAESSNQGTMWFRQSALVPPLTPCKQKPYLAITKIFWQKRNRAHGSIVIYNRAVELCSSLLKVEIHASRGDLRCFDRVPGFRYGGDLVASHSLRSHRRDGSPRCALR